MNLVFYAYGGHQMGMGHIYRSQALIKAFQKRSGSLSASFLSLNYRDGIAKLKEFGYPVIEIPLDLPEKQEIEYCADALRAIKPDVFIADALQISPAKMAMFKNYSKYLVSLDNTGDGRLLADLVVNVLFRAPSRDSNRVEFEGLKYLILRDEFCKPNRPEAIIKPAVSRILVTQGGSDTYGVVLKIARALGRLDTGIEIVLLLGPAFQHERDLEAMLQEPGRSFIVERDVSNMSGLLSRCDLAITGAGNTLFELAAVGVPCIVLTQEYKELETIEYVRGYGFFRFLGLSEKVSEEEIYNTVAELVENYTLRKNMSEASREIIDGLGAKRVVNMIMDKGGFNR